MEIKIKIPDIKIFLRRLKSRITFLYLNLKHKIERFIENRNRKYKDLILDKLTNETYIRYFLRCNKFKGLFIVDFYLPDKELILFRYNRLTKRLHIYSDLIVTLILIERNIYLDKSGLITVKTEKGIETGKLSAYSYHNSGLTLYFGPFQYRTVIPANNETHRYLFSILDEAINQK